MNARLLLPAGVLWLFLAPGCSEGPRLQSVRADVEVRLPEAPDFQAQPAARKYPDGAHSVLSLIETADRQVGLEVTVRGLVADTVLCAAGAPDEQPKTARPGPSKKEEADEDCHPPSHLYLADDVSDEASRLLIVGWSANKVRGVRRGQELTFRGTFGRVSPDGVFIRQAGLVTVAP